MPSGIGIIDTLIGFPHADLRAAYSWVTKQTKDPEELESPIEFLFKDVPNKRLTNASDPVAVTLAEMDRWGIARGLVGVSEPGDHGDVALRRYPDRFIPSTGAGPNDGAAGLARIVRARELWGVRAVTLFPPGTFPPVPINDRK